MKHELKIKVYPGDTDCYGVVWHGAYIKWLEAGRVGLFDQLGISYSELNNSGITTPVVELNIRYKFPAKAHENLILTTTLEQFSRIGIVFNHELNNAETGRLNITARVKNVFASPEGRLLKVIPECLREKYEILHNHSM